MAREKRLIVRGETCDLCGAGKNESRRIVTLKSLVYLSGSKQRIKGAPSLRICEHCLVLAITDPGHAPARNLGRGILDRIAQTYTALSKNAPSPQAKQGRMDAPMQFPSGKAV
ncbi:MAG: hypothetical protein P4K78_10680 [Terracidiphilus sp.]|nr:hypothetical protein [Terracidiphilus sp.]